MHKLDEPVFVTERKNWLRENVKNVAQDCCECSKNVAFFVNCAKEVALLALK